LQLLYLHQSLSVPFMLNGIDNALSELWSSVSWKHRHHVILFCVHMYSIPATTSDELKDLLYGLLKRNPADRLDFRK